MASRWSWSVLFIFMCIESIVAYQFIVGGSKGWTVPAEIESYNKWAGMVRFQIGDTLLFKYNKEEDSVLQVTKQGYNTCNSSSPIASFKNGNTVFKLPVSGPFYFISGNSSNCQKGEKLVVVVLAPCHWGRGENCGKSGSHSPSPTPDPSPSAAPASSPGSSVSPSSTPSPSPSVAPASSPGSSVSPSSTPSPSPSVAPASSPGSSVSPSSAPTPSPSPSAVPTPGSATSPVPAPSGTTVPAVSPSPSSGAVSPSESPLSSPPPPPPSSSQAPETSTPASPPSNKSTSSSAAARSPVLVLNLILALLFAAFLRG
uniref:TSA: Wollemia nobilis Ref_Wollemi_Transcript_10519_1703 transcribed RNA sequence n=1 Tax=Wollemia nobilis TaxID=56998 RepID=A0A0C9RVQ1_9CONI